MRLYDQRLYCHTSNCCPVIELDEETGEYIFFDPHKLRLGCVRFLPGDLDSIFEHARPVPEKLTEPTILYQSTVMAAVAHLNGEVQIMVHRPGFTGSYAPSHEEWNVFLREAPARLKPLLAA